MGGTVVPDLEDISLCEVVGSWTGSPVPVQNDTTIWDSIQGARCMQSYSAGAAVRNASWSFGVDKDFTGKLLVMWFAFSKKLYSASTGIMKIRITDVNGYYRDWYIFDKNSLPNTSWIPWVIHAEIGYDYESNVLFNVTKVRYVAWRIEDTVLGKTYIWWDAWRFGTGLTIKGGTSGDPANLEKLYTEETLNANAYGIISKVSGVYYIQGQIKIGSTVNAEATYFKDTSKVAVFRGIKGNPSTFSKILFQGNAGADTEIYFGEAIGGKGVSGLFISSESSNCRFALDATSTSRMKWQLCGTTFLKARTIEFPAYNASWLREVLNCNFEMCAEVIANTTTMTYCNFISSAGRAVRISSASHRVTECNFINCQTAIHHDVGGPVGTPLEYDYNKLMFTGGIHHIENSAITPNYYINIDRLNGSNPDGAKINNSNGGITTLLAISVHLYLTGLVAGSEVEILETGTQNELAHVENSETTFDYQYYYAEGVYIDIIIHKPDYEWYVIWNYGALSQTNASIPVAQRKDRVYNNP